jgi:hypothetical protein
MAAKRLGGIYKTPAIKDIQVELDSALELLAEMRAAECEAARMSRTPNRLALTQRILHNNPDLAKLKGRLWEQGPEWELTGDTSDSRKRIGPDARAFRHIGPINHLTEEDDE